MLYQVKAGIIGLDKLGMIYAGLIKDHVKDLSLIAAAGRTQKELLYAKNDLSLEYVYGDEKALLENHDVDALFVFSEARFKANLAIQAIDAGKHVFLVNPIALNLDDAVAVQKTASSHPSQTVMCASPVKSFPILLKLKSFIDSGQLGKIHFIHTDSSFFQSMKKEYASSSGSRYLDKLLDELELFNWIYDGELSEALVETSGNSRDGKKQSIELETKLMFSYPEYLQMHHFTQSILGKEKNSLKTNLAVDAVRLALAFEKSDVLNTSVDLRTS
ncbi:MAG: gfo/Idh/MocA family oxidoreductase [Chitinophagia bacterium]|nr:gfo/Idh/MocA family oxidoreductase [Chitinophagia bacterium]